MFYVFLIFKSMFHIPEHIYHTIQKQIHTKKKKIKIFRVGGKNRVGLVTPIKHFFLGLSSPTNNTQPKIKRIHK